MTPAAGFLRAEIERTGPILFSRFMEVALYHPEFGYYRTRDPFGAAGDFFTAAQLQPVFGILIASMVRELFNEMGRPANFTVVDLGAGRGEMGEAFKEWNYVPVDAGRGELPVNFTGVVFANEFFDALPVDAAARRGARFVMLRVGHQHGRFVWTDGEPPSNAAAEYLSRHADDAERVEIPLASLDWIDRIASHLHHGFLVVIDYGYTAREIQRFTQGSLMSYKKHAALEDVLAQPGAQDITAHVPFTALEERASQAFHRVRFERLAQTLLRAGEPDQFAGALRAASPTEEMRRRLQLKTLLFGMGENFQTMVLRKHQ
jgi:SAM-dependent MidA family methyltransferase